MHQVKVIIVSAIDRDICMRDVVLGSLSCAA